MKNIIMAVALAAVAFGLAGCRVIEVENKGEEIARDSEGKPVLTKDGTIQTVKRGWSVYHNQHWMITEADALTAQVRPDDIQFAVNGLNSKPDGQNLVSLVKTSLEGTAELAAKIGVAIASGGGSVAAEGGAAAVVSLAKQAYSLFKSKGGDEAKASVSASPDGSVTVTDGNVCVRCADGVCSPVE